MNPSRRATDVDVVALGAGRETLTSVGSVSDEQRGRARGYVLEEADLRYPEEWQTPDRVRWRDEMLSILGLPPGPITPV